MSSKRRITTTGRTPAPRSLSMRRTWYADEDTSAQGSTAGTSSAGTQNTGGTPEQLPSTVPYERFAEVNKKMREFEVQALKLADEKKKRDEAEMLARGEHQKVIDELKPRAERAALLEQTLQQYLDAEMASVPEDMKFLFESGDVAERVAKVQAAKAKGIIGKPAAPQTDAGATGGGVKISAASLTAQEMQIAQKMGMTPEKYAEIKHKTGGSPE